VGALARYAGHFDAANADVISSLLLGLLFSTVLAERRRHQALMTAVSILAVAIVMFENLDLQRVDGMVNWIGIITSGEYLAIGAYMEYFYQTGESQTIVRFLGAFIVPFTFAFGLDGVLNIDREGGASGLGIFLVHTAPALLVLALSLIWVWSRYRRLYRLPPINRSDDTGNT